MRFFAFASLAASLLPFAHAGLSVDLGGHGGASVSIGHRRSPPRQSIADLYVASESPVAKAGLLANIGPDGSKSSGAKAGIVIASPSTVNPDYLYTWVRDSSLVFKVLIDQYTSGQDASVAARDLIDAFVSAEAILQQLPNPSGTVDAGGLGEPKFNINETAFTDSWGRPQRDGPALRATAIISYANWLIDHGNSSWVTKTLWPIIKLDLDYVSVNWNQSTYDLWEEVDSSSFFTTAVQHRALREGAALASSIGQSSVVSGYDDQADNLLCFMQSYWNPSEGYMTANTGGGRSGKDANTVITSIRTFDPAAGCDASTFQPCSDKALSNLKVYVDSFRSIYNINAGWQANAPVAVGRYPEDIYYDGNPWYLTTFAVAEQLYDALIVWKAQGSLTVSATSLAFFRQFQSGVQPGTYSASTPTYGTLVEAVASFADGFLTKNAEYTPAGGALSEQYNKTTGAQTSAADLTWSYAAALTAFAARGGFASPSWGAKGLKVPSVCKANPVPTVAVTFNLTGATTNSGEGVYITGSVDALKIWSTTDPVPLKLAGNTTWSVTVGIPASTIVQYKYLKLDNGTVTWESDPNNQITTPAGGNLTINDTWR
ncbi:glycoside hydrolase family 15 protein [Phanerochaete sordida]|uniref:Glucoamylase n=1 Tax=Phanerochaete sordida TaxID=48140 RepID=A0A9P3LJR8_9APHY|nr:glycoside hydrolase family 15 protein [Phanerochaete sordida]